MKNDDWLQIREWAVGFLQLLNQDHFALQLSICLP